MTNQTDLPILNHSDQYMIAGCGVNFNHFTPEFLEAVRRETRFVALEEAPGASSFAEAEKIGLRRKKQGIQASPLSRGRSYGAVAELF